MNNDKYFKVVSDFDFKISEKMLYEIYLPIIKMETMLLYKKLLVLNNDSNAYNILSFIEKINMLEPDFFNHIHKLEAIGLIETYKNNIDDKIIFFIKLNDTKSIEEFIKNKDLYRLLENELSDEEIKKIHEKFNSLDYLQNCSNVTWTIKDVFSVKKKHDEVFHINSIKDGLLEKTGLEIEISDKVYEFIRNIFNTNNWSYEKIIDLLILSIADPKSKPHISYPIMLIHYDEIVNPYGSEYSDVEIDQQKNMKNTTNTSQYAFLNRDIGIYEADANLADFENVLNDYKYYDAIKYISSIHRKKISDDLLEFIEELQEQYKFNDAIINVLFDFCTWKNKGYFNKEYIKKIAETIYSINLFDVERLILHLQNPKQKEFKKVSTNKIKKPEKQVSIFDDNNEKEDDGFI